MSVENVGGARPVGGGDGGPTDGVREATGAGDGGADQVPTFEGLKWPSVALIGSAAVDMGLRDGNGTAAAAVERFTHGIFTARSTVD
ncbi:hypothetical protein CSA80_04595 [Candidatus Saccharibacteria bacterium]|nr:MAG: hypothetical protein CSA80_04595 [Candidatus Saccharibacteria bacterium]